MKSLIFLFCLLAAASAVQLPPNFHKCNRKNPDFSQCVLEAAQYGISQLTRPYDELNLPSLDPLELTEVTINGGDGPVSLKQHFTDCKLFGLPYMKLESLELDFATNELHVVGVIPEVRKVCLYQIKGQILLLHIDGHGNSTITLKNIKFTDTLHFEKVQKKGKDFLRFSSSTVTLDPELVVYDFVNADNKGVTDKINPVLNENWKEVFEDLKSGYEKMIDSVVLNLVNGFFSKVSLAEAFD